MTKNDQFIKQFLDIVNNGLPGEDAHSLLMPINRPFTSEALKNKAEYRQSAVSIILFEEDSTLKSILIERPEYAGLHSRQISFPGGKREPDDPNLEYTARRESYEEINLPMTEGKLVTKLSEIYIPVSKFLVQPYVFLIEKELPDLIPDQREVASIITYDLFTLTDANILKYMDMVFENGHKQKNIPYFEIEGHIVWGATAMMLAELKAIIDQIN
jgi:8-oxo-dGTP pyrophosphatase MutT (NUDIX family)